MLTLMITGSIDLAAQVNGDQVGAWYMYFWNTTIKESAWGVQGDAQYRNWDLGGDMEQLLLRGGVSYQPAGTPIKFTLGYAHITSGTFGESDNTTVESRVYEEAMLPQKFGERFHLNHRFRYEQRFAQDQDPRTRWRYALFLNVPLTAKTLSKRVFYLAMYNELFINGERGIGDGRSVELFDRNRLYAGIGYGILNDLRVQTGYMRQTTDVISKDQMQLGLHHKF